MISLCTFVKNEAHCLEHMIKSIIDYVDDLVIVDTGSTDGTLDIAKKYNARIFEVGFTDFGKIRTLTMQLAKTPWVLMLDADETLEHPELLSTYIKAYDKKIKMNVEAIALPRKRWLDLNKTQQTETEAYPDWQVRLVKSSPHFKFNRALHEEFHGGAVTHIDSGIVINHFHDVFKDEHRLKIRYDLYEKLSPIAGVHIHGGKPL
jgi:glycosyltransferase involved in cell wall biosynthesis